MMKYKCYIISLNEVGKIIGCPMKFKNGFVDENCEEMRRIDYFNLLQEAIGRPIVSIRPSGRERWDEILVLCAKGKVLEGGECILDYKKEEELKRVLTDIFAEHSEDQYDVFDFYSATCRKKTWESVTHWVYETF